MRVRQRFDALLTLDRGLDRQPGLGGLVVRIVIISAYSNHIAHLRPLVGGIPKVAHRKRYCRLPTGPTLLPEIAPAIRHSNAIFDSAGCTQLGPEHSKPVV